MDLLYTPLNIISSKQYTSVEKKKTRFDIVSSPPCVIDSDILPVLSSYETGSLRDINVEYVAVFMNNVGSVRDRLSHPHQNKGFPL